MRRIRGLRAGASSITCWRRAPALAHVAERGDGTLVGYVLGRDGHAAMHVGPVVAEDEAIGLALLSACDGCDAGARDPGCARPASRHHGSGCSKPGATAPRGFMRMLRGPCPAVEDAGRIFALAGPELA